MFRIGLYWLYPGFRIRIRIFWSDHDPVFKIRSNPDFKLWSGFFWKVGSGSYCFTRRSEPCKTHADLQPWVILINNVSQFWSIYYICYKNRLKYNVYASLKGTVLRFYIGAPWNRLLLRNTSFFDPCGRYD